MKLTDDILEKYGIHFVKTPDNERIYVMRNVPHPITPEMTDTFYMGKVYDKWSLTFKRCNPYMEINADIETENDLINILKVCNLL